MFADPRIPTEWPIHHKDAMRAHPPHGDHAHVTANKKAIGGGDPGGYEIRVRGPIGPTMMQAFPALTATRSGHDTLLTGSSRFTELPEVMPRLASGELPALCHTIVYEYG